MLKYSIERFLEQIPTSEVYLIAGPSASGKTTLAQQLEQQLQGVVISMDDFSLDEQNVPREYSEEYGEAPQWDHIDAYDISSMQFKISQLITFGVTTVPIYDMVKEKQIGTKSLKWRKPSILIVEGIYAFIFKNLFLERGFTVLNIYTAVPELIRFQRLKSRDEVRHLNSIAKFEKHIHFLRKAEERWILQEENQADVVLTSENIINTSLDA